MFKLVVLSVLLALVAAKPSYLHVPSAVSYQARTDVISKPIVATAYAAAPAVAYSVPDYHYSAPAVAVPSAVSYQSRTDVVSKPVVTTYSAHAPVVAAYSAPAVAAYGTYGGYGYGAPALVKSYGYGAPAHYW